MKSLENRLLKVRQDIQQGATACGRSSESITLLAVSKTQSPDQLEAAYNLGQRAFGENYLQEAREKQQALANLDIEWHFIGPIQSNKTREIAEHFDWVHSVDRIKIATRLSEQRPENLPPLNICLQINIDNESTKSGIELEKLPELVEQIHSLPGIRLRGLMAIPRANNSEEQQLDSFQRLANAKNAYPFMDTLSMGMSSDLPLAIAAGATIVRIGTAIFGKRSQKEQK